MPTDETETYVRAKSPGKGPKELSGIYDPGPYTPKPEPEQEQEQDDYPFGMLHPPTVGSKDASLRDSLTAEFDGITYVIPMTEGDKVLSEEEAIKRFRETHKHMGGFDSLDSANAFRNNDDEILDLWR